MIIGLLFCVLNHDIGHKQKDEFLVTSNVNSFDYFLLKKISLWKKSVGFRIFFATSSNIKVPGKRVFIDCHLWFYYFRIA